MGLFKKKTPIVAPRQRIPQSKNSVYSYHSKRSERTDQLSRNPEDQDFKKNKRKQRRVVQHTPALFVVFAVFIGVLFLTTINNKVSVKLKDDKNTTLRNKTIYQESAKKFIGKSVVNRSKLLFDSDGLAAQLKREFPEITAVSISLPILGRTPTVNVQTSKPGFIFVSGQEAYLVGTNGIALLNVRDGQNISELGLRTVNDESGVKIEIGKAALPKEQALFISTVVEQLEKQNIKIESLTIPTSPYDLHVKIAGTPYFIKFNILEDPKQQSGSFIALKKKLDSDEIIPKEYIDVRVGERVYYK